MINFRPTGQLLVLALACVGGSIDCFAVALGATKDDVIAERGNPTSHAAAGSKEILSYPKGIRIVLEDGRVVSAVGVTLTVEDPTPEPTPSPVPRPKRATPAPTPTLEPTPEPTESPSPTPSPIPLPTKRAVQSAPVLPGKTLHLGTELPLSGKMLILGVHLVLTLGALFLAFRLWKVETVSSGLLLIALLDLIIHAGLELLGNLTAGISNLPAVETLVAWAVMVVALRHFSVNKNVQDAVRTASAVKLSVALLQLGGVLLLLHFMAR